MTGASTKSYQFKQTDDKHNNYLGIIFNDQGYNGRISLVKDEIIHYFFFISMPYLL